MINVASFVTILYAVEMIMKRFYVYGSFVRRSREFCKQACAWKVVH